MARDVSLSREGHALHTGEALHSQLSPWIPLARQSWITSAGSLSEEPTPTRTKSASTPGPIRTPTNGDMPAWRPAVLRPLTSPHTVIRPRLLRTASIAPNRTEAGSFIHFCPPATMVLRWPPLRSIGRPGSIGVPGSAGGHVL